MKVEIKRATPDQAEILTQMAFAAKSYWGYPEPWLQLWTPIFTVLPEFIERFNTMLVMKMENLSDFMPYPRKIKRQV